MLLFLAARLASRHGTHRPRRPLPYAILRQWIAPMWIANGVVSAVVALIAATTYLGLRVVIEYDIRATYFIFAIWCEVSRQTRFRLNRRWPHRRHHLTSS